MADRVDKATRSRIMRAIKSKDTGPERKFRQALLQAQVAGWTPDGKGLPGTPDFVFYRVQLAVFVHGCFWHLCRVHYKAPAASGFQKKMDANRCRDIRVRRQLRALGWATMVVWEHEDPAHAAKRVQARLALVHRLRQVRQRLAGRDCPEEGGRCNDSDCAYECAKELPF